jgi:hypothetical protein
MKPTTTRPDRQCAGALMRAAVYVGKVNLALGGAENATQIRQRDRGREELGPARTRNSPRYLNGAERHTWRERERGTRPGDRARSPRHQRDGPPFGWSWSPLVQNLRQTTWGCPRTDECPNPCRASGPGRDCGTAFAVLPASVTESAIPPARGHRDRCSASAASPSPLFWPLRVAESAVSHASVHRVRCFTFGAFSFCLVSALRVGRAARKTPESMPRTMENSGLDELGRAKPRTRRVSGRKAPDSMKAST